METKENPVTKRQEILATEASLQPELQKILDKFAEYGYTTHKGTNSYILANIMVDYADKALKANANLLTHLNYWETQDIGVLSNLAFKRYHLYNMRSKPQLHQLPVTAKDAMLGERLTASVKYSEDLAAQADPVIVSLGEISKIQGAKPLKTPYEDLYDHAVLYCGDRRPENIKFHESFMEADGAYIEQDFLILADEEGQAIFVPTARMIQRIKQEGITGSAKILLFTRRADNLKCPYPRVSEEMVVDGDFLRFVTTELFAKFKILNRMSRESFKKFLFLRYGKEVLIDGARIISPFDDRVSGEILDFALKNVLPPQGLRFELTQAPTAKVVLDTNGKEVPEDLMDYLRRKVPSIVPGKDLMSILQFYLGEYYREKYLWDSLARQDEDGFAIGVSEVIGSSDYWVLEF